MEIAQGRNKTIGRSSSAARTSSGPATPTLAADLILLLQAQEQRAGLFYLLPGPTLLARPCSRPRIVLFKDPGGDGKRGNRRVDPG